MQPFFHLQSREDSNCSVALWLCWIKKQSRAEIPRPKDVMATFLYFSSNSILQYLSLFALYKFSAFEKNNAIF